MAIWIKYPIEDISPKLAITTWVWMGLIIVMIFMRTFAKIKGPRERHTFRPTRLGPWRWGLAMDDYLLILAVLHALPALGLILWACELGFGKRTEELLALDDPSLPYGGGPKLVQKTLQLFWWMQILYAAVMMLTKESILVQYMRTFRSGNTFRFRCVCYMMMLIIFGFYTTSIFVVIFAYSPIEAAWTGGGVQRVNTTVIWHARGWFNTATDFIIFFMPIYNGVHNYATSSKLSGKDPEKRTPTRETIAKYILISAGAAVTIVSLIRTLLIPRIGFERDPMWNSINFCIFSVTEDSLGVVAVCLLSLRSAVAQLAPWIIGASPSSSRRNSDEVGLHNPIRESSMLGFCAGLPKNPYAQYEDDLYDPV